jgi:flavin reductase (DIM6/NTAB) family NADH-FMN oxidoreductase RutF
MQMPFVLCAPAAASRILYCNPVCFLSTMLASLPSSSSPAPFFNVMAASWMTPANSHGAFVFCIKKSRASFAAIVPGASFGLSVATSSQTDLLLQVGASSARAGPKPQRIPHLTRCRFANAAATSVAAAAAAAGNKRSRNSFAALACDSDGDDYSIQQQQHAAAEPLFFIASTCAHIAAEVIRVDDAADAGHALVVAQVTKAAVHPAYWRCEGRVFGVPAGCAHPPPLSFVGSQKFAQVARDFRHFNQRCSSNLSKPAGWISCKTFCRLCCFQTQQQQHQQLSPEPAK